MLFSQANSSLCFTLKSVNLLAAPRNQFTVSCPGLGFKVVQDIYNWFKRYKNDYILGYIIAVIVRKRRTDC